MELSLILCSRNDEYMGNSRWRLETALNCLGDRIRKIGRTGEVEVIVADWGSEVPLREVITLEPDAAALTSFVTVPRALARDRQGASSFPEVIALNAAARRAGGRYIGRIDQDTIVGERFLRWFFEGGGAAARRSDAGDTTLWFANRRRVPFRFAARCPERRQVERFLRVFGRLLPASRGNRWFDDEFWSGSVGIWLAPRARWQECGGYDERLIFYNWMETDMIRRLGQKYPLVDLGRLTGDDFYHLDHLDPRAPLAARAHDRKNPDIDPAAPAPALCQNSAAWGLAECDLPRQAAARPPATVRPRPGFAAVRDAGECAGLVARVAAGTAADRIAVSWTHLSAVARRRVTTASRGLAGQPIWFWPGTLWRLWHGRKVNRAR